MLLFLVLLLCLVLFVAAFMLPLAFIVFSFLDGLLGGTGDKQKTKQGW